MDATGIEKLCEALKLRLDAALVAAGLSGDTIISAPNEPAALGHPLIVFPYRISANASLRNTERRLPPRPPATVPIVHRRAAPLDVQLLLTVGAEATGLSLHPLGVAIQALDEAPELSGAAVQGDTIRLSLEPVTSEELSRIWAMFPSSSARTSVVYLASPVWIDPRRVAPLSANVVRDERSIGQRDGRGAQP